jgi:DivIVA domain-containing protein
MGEDPCAGGTDTRSWRPGNGALIGVGGRTMCVASNEGVPMEAKTHSPSFTVSLRGYDREEVDHYIDSLAEALEQVDDSSEQNRRLHAHVNQLNARIKELEDRLRSETPRTGAMVGERIGILLREAEEAASETVARAETKAAAILSAAEAKEQEADDIVRAALARGEDQSRRIESAARAEAAEIVAEAEARATARTRQIEQWAEQVISHTRAEEARLYTEQQAAKEAATAELQALASQRANAACTLIELREAIGRAVGLATPDEPSEAAGPPALPMGTGPMSTGRPEIRASSGSAWTMSGVDDLPTGEHPAADMPEGEQFEAKLDAWVTGGNDIGA